MKKIIKFAFTISMIAIMVFALGAPAFATNDTIGFITVLPTEKTVYRNETFELSVSATGAGVNYQWFTVENGPGNPISDKGPDKNVLRASTDHNTKIYCTISDKDGLTATSCQPCQITVIDRPTTTIPPASTISPNLNPNVAVSKPTITKQPVSVRLSAGQCATLSVSASCQNYGNGVDLRYQWYVSSKNSANYALPIQGATSASYTTPVNTTDYYYLVEVTATNGVSDSASTFSNLACVSYAAPDTGTPVITKNPTGETVKAGGNAMFIARADNVASRQWRIVSKDTKTTVPAKDAPSYFKGLSVSGADTDTLVLSNIPETMNDWSVECKFVGTRGGVVYTNGAIITIPGAQTSSGSNNSSSVVTTNNSSSNSGNSNSSAVVTSPSPSAGFSEPQTSSPIVVGTVSAPVINTQPEGAVLSSGETTTLSVSASAGDTQGAELKYQWYSSNKNSNANGTAISGAQSATYTPDTISGSKYYYVGVWSTDGTHTSKIVYSSPVAVTYTADANPSPSPDDQSADKDKDSTTKSLASKLIVPIVVMVIALAAGLGAFFILKGSSKKSKQYDDDDDDDDRV